MFRSTRTAAAVCILFLVSGSVSAEDIEFELVSFNCSEGNCAAGCRGKCACGGCASGKCGHRKCRLRNWVGGGCGLGGRLGNWVRGGCGLGGGCEAPDDVGKLFGVISDCSPWNVGGWLQSGWHGRGNGLFNNHANRLNLHQAWMYVERTADTSRGIGLGGRMDLTYGRDAADTQAFGGNGWDTGWDRGAGFGWAMPQLYAEIATENTSTIIGHFYTLVGYETVTAPDNFFYSHAVTMYNSEPFTHTGLLMTHNLNDKTTAYAGWTLGWDTGFERVQGGSNFLGGITRKLASGAALTYVTTAGNFGNRSQGFNGYSHSFVFDQPIGRKLNYVFQSDLLRVSGTGEDNVGINQYLFYNVNDCAALGLRFEWWKGDDITGFDYGGRSAAPTGSTSYYEITAGVNYRINGRTVIRPECRYDWSPALGHDQAVLGVDWVTVF